MCRQLVLWIALLAPPPAARPGPRLRQGPLHEVRIPHPDARRREALHGRLRPQGRLADVPDPADPHAVQRRPYGVDQYRDDLGPSPLFGKDGYIFVYQDVRGRWMSEGEFVNMRPHNPAKKAPKDIDESTDTYDTIDWLVKNVPNHNGKVGQWGISYPGFYTAAGMIDAHPALKAASPQAPVTDWFVGDDCHHNGALFLPHCFNFMANFGQPRPEPTKKPDAAVRARHARRLRLLPRHGPARQRRRASTSRARSPFWNEVMEHGTYDDFWKARNLRPHLKNIKPAVLTVGGWFDAENLFGALETYKARRGEQPAGATTTWSWARGSTAAGAAATATSLGDVSVQRQDRRRSTARRSNCRSSSTT